MLKFGVKKVKRPIIRNRGSTLTLASREQPDCCRPLWGGQKSMWMGPSLAKPAQLALGLTARNSSGQILFTAWRVLQCLNAEEAEAMAWVEGDCLATEWGPGSVIFDTDCARIVQRPNM